MSHRIAVVAALALALVACKDSKTASDVKPCVKSSVETAGEGVKTGGKTAVEGVKTFGKSVGGLFGGGTDEAKREWKAGSQKTSQAAKGGGADTRTQGRQTGADCD